MSSQEAELAIFIEGNEWWTLLKTDCLIVPTNALQDPFIPIPQKFETLNPIQQIHHPTIQLTNPGPS